MVYQSPRYGLQYSFMLNAEKKNRTINYVNLLLSDSQAPDTQTGAQTGYTATEAWNFIQAILSLAGVSLADYVTRISQADIVDGGN